MWNCWWAHWSWDRFPSEYFRFPLKYLSTNVTHSSSAEYSSQQKDKWANPGKLQTKPLLFRISGCIGQKSAFTLSDLKVFSWNFTCSCMVASDTSFLNKLNKTNLLRNILPMMQTPYTVRWCKCPNCLHKETEEGEILRCKSHLGCTLCLLIYYSVL
jgi:hypothetical protein